MRLNFHKLLMALAGCILAACSSSTVLAQGGVALDFSTNPEDRGVEFFAAENGNPRWEQSGGVNNSGYLVVTDNGGGERGAIVFPDLSDPPGSALSSFQITADLRVGAGSADPADGFSFNLVRPDDPLLEDGNNYASSPANEANLPEEGSTTGLGIGFDEWQSGARDPFENNWVVTNGTGSNFDVGQVISNDDYSDNVGEANPDFAADPIDGYWRILDAGGSNLDAGDPENGPHFAISDAVYRKQIAQFDDIVAEQFGDQTCPNSLRDAEDEDGNAFREIAFDCIGMSIRVDNKLVGQAGFPVKNGELNDQQSLQTGPRGQGVSALGWAQLRISVTPTDAEGVSNLLVTYKDRTVFDEAIEYTPTPGQLVFGGRTGGANSHHHIDNINIVTDFDDLTLGDFNSDGNIDLEDYMTLLNNMNTGGQDTTFADGDINFTGRVDLDDFVDFRRAFRDANQGRAATSSVPEPHAGLLALLGLFGLTALRRSRRS